MNQKLPLLIVDIMDFGCVGSSFENQIVENISENIGIKNIGKTNVMTKVTAVDPLCGCIKDSDFDDDEALLDGDVAPTLSILVGGSEDDDETMKRISPSYSGSRSNEAPVKKALDTIQQTLDDVIIAESSVHHISLGITIPSPGNVLPDILAEPSMSSQVVQPSMFAASPSPCLLNPLDSDWKENDHLMIPAINKVASSTAKSILVSNLDTSTTSSLASLLLKLEEGYRVRLTGGPISCLAGEDEVLLYLHPDHSRICVESASNRQIGDEDEKKQQETVDFWIEIAISDILRLESNRSLKGFSIVLEKEPNCLVYYDFETSNAIDREVLVSTIMIVLDRTHNTQKGMEWIEGGTLDQPIPCSPSLEQMPFPFCPSLEHNETLSQGVHNQLSPSKRTQIYNSAERETETSLVIHLEDVGSTDQSDYWGHRRTSGTNNHEMSPNPKNSFSCSDVIIVDDVDDMRIDFKPSASSTHLATAASSSQLAAVAWCGGNDICTLALRDIADACTGIFAMKAAGERTPLSSSVGSDQILLVEEFIAAALGAPASVYSYFAEGDIWSNETTPSTHHRFSAEKGQRDTANSFVRNRATLLNAQAARLRTLRNEMTFAAALKQSKERMQFVQTVCSFDDIYHSRNGRSQKLRVATEAADRFHSSPLLKSVVGNMTMHDQSGFTKEMNVDEVVYYDSDPEDVRPRTNQDKAPRRAVVDRLHEDASDNLKANWRQQALTGNGFDEIGTTKRLSKKLDDEVIVEIVHAMTNERFTLMWHPTQNDENPNRRPICSKVWIEAGVYLSDGTFLLPKLTWSKISPDNEQSKSLEKLDLLDICRICPTKKIDRSQHPFAVTQRSFFIETQREIFVFQAQSTEERDRIVYGMKLVVARLASLLMLRDIRAAEEFFGAIANMVPGEAPAWARGKQSENDGNETTTRPTVSALDSIL